MGNIKVNKKALLNAMFKSLTIFSIFTFFALLKGGLEYFLK